MKPFFCAASIVFLAYAAVAEDFTVRVHETETIEIPGATAAYAIDPAIADATVTRPGFVAVAGRTAGTTQIIAVTAVGTKSYLITVGVPRPAQVPAAVAAGEPIARAESRYSSSSSQLQNAFDVFTTDGERRSQLHLLNVHYLRDTFGRSRNAFPSAYYRIASPGRELIILDDIVDLSPLTIRTTQLRGLHLRQGPWELHGGYAASTLYEDLFLPADRRWVAGASYTIGAGDLRWIPSAYVFFSEPRNTGARRGAVGSLAAEYRRGDMLFARGELAASRSPAASLEARYESPAQTLRARAWYKPDDFPTLALSDLPGTHAAVDWSDRVTDRLTLDSYATFDRMSLSAFAQSVGVSNVALRYQATRHLSILSGAEASFVRRDSATIRTIGIPVGVSYDLPSFGAAASYRILKPSNASRRGDTLRLSMRGTIGVFRVNAWAERQRQAPTLDLIFREQPGLELALLRLGISVRSPEDLSRVLRDNAALINLGFIEGVTVNLTPLRRQAGADVALVTPGARDQIHLHAVFDRVDGVTGRLDSSIATLTYSRRVFEATDVYGSFTLWRSGFLTRDTRTAYEVGVRQRFDGVPRFLQRSGTIEGVVFADPEMKGMRGRATTPLADVVVTLDTSRTARTDRSGRYLFSDVKPGPHRVAAQLPSSTPAFFTTPSRVDVGVPGRADFGIVPTPARISGRVMSDASLGIAGVVISATAASGKTLTATTDTEGEFVLATPPGAYRVSFALESLPSGYTVSGESTRVVQATPDRPQSIAFAVRALRSIAGSAPGASEVRIDPLGRTVTTDAAGNYVFRSLPPGTFTLSARANGRRLTRTITLPAEPAMLQHVVVGAETVSPQISASAPTRAEGEWRVQVGAFRVAENVAETERQLERLGYRPEVTQIGDLQIVSIGPFASLEAAEREAARLQNAAIENIVVSEYAVAQPKTAAPSGAFVVQVGAFREPSNAQQLVRRLARLGRRARTAISGALTFVSVGPFASRNAAAAAGEQLRRAGFEALVTKR